MTQTTYTAMIYYIGPLNDNYGYDWDLVAPAEQVEAVLGLEGDEMWNALEACDWVERDTVADGVRVYDTFVDPITEALELTRTPAANR